MKNLYLFNPLNEDFTVQYDINGDGKPQSFTLHAGEREAFEKPVWEHIRKHLAHKVGQGLRGKGTYEDAIKKALELIED